MDRLQEAKELLAATARHTPGPWSTWEQPWGDMCDVVVLNEKGNAKSWVVKDAWLKDGNLIAAAPVLRDLLDWAVGTVEWLRNGGACEGCGKAIREAEAELAELRLLVLSAQSRADRAEAEVQRLRHEANLPR